MGLRFHKTIFLFALIIFHGNDFFGRRVEATPLEDVCRMTSNEEFCLLDFGSGMMRASITTLAKLAIWDVIDNMNTTQFTIDRRLVGPNPPRVHKILSACKNSYTPVYNSFVASAYDNLNRGLHVQLGQQAVQAYEAGDQCLSAYKLFIDAPFKSYIDRLLRLSNILQVIANAFLSKS